MNASLLPVETDTRLTGYPFLRLTSHVLRRLLQVVGIGLYHLGLARFIIDLSPQRIRTVLYHAVEEYPSSYTDGLGMSISPAHFKQHLEYYQHHYNVISMKDLVRGQVTPKSLIVTFDDGYASVAEHAVPALEERGLPATVYLIGKAVAGGMVWVNRLNHALNRHPQLTMEILETLPGLIDVERGDIIRQIQIHYPPAMIEQLLTRLEEGLPDSGEPEKLFLTVAQIVELKRRGISFGFHSNDHYNLKLCNEQALRQQLDSRSIDHLLDSRTFAYPFGYCGDREADRLEARGFQRAMLVHEDTPLPRKGNLLRSEPTGRSAAHVFAQLEVEEPILRWLRSRLRSRQSLTLAAHRSTVRD